MNNILALFNVGSNVMLSLGIIFVLVFIVFYIRQRLSDYDNKINSMFQLVSKMTNEIRFLKTPLPTIHENTVLPDFKTEELRVVSLDVNEEETNLIALISSFFQYTQEGKSSRFNKGAP